MSDISNQLIKDSYNYVLQSDLSTGIVYRIGGGIPVNPKFLSGLTINSNFNYSNGTEQPGFVLITDAFGNATWGPISGSSSGDYLPLSGGTVTGPTIFTSGLTANTISATTYYNLPTDVFVTGGTYTSGNVIFTNNTGGTFNVSGFAVGGGGGQIFYLNLSQSQNGNRLLSTTASTASEQSTGVTINNGVTSTIASFQSQPLNTTLLPGGIWSFYLHSYKQNTNASFNIFVEVYKRTSGGTETLLFATDPTPVTTNSPNPSMQLTDGYFSGTPLSVSDSVVAVVRATNTDNQPHIITLVTEGSTHYSYVVSTIPTQQGLTCDTLSGCSIIQTIQTDVSNKLDKSGGTITGNLTINSGLTATTISATTYYGLPTDIRVTGATKSGSVATFTNNTGGTFTLTGLTDVFVTGATKSGSVATFRNSTGGTFTLTGLTDTFVTGATKSGSVATFTNNTGGTFTLTGLTDVFVTGGTYSSSTGVTTFRNNTGGTFTVSGYFTPSNDIYVTAGSVDHGPNINADNLLLLTRSDLTNVTIDNLVNISNTTKSEVDSLIPSRWIIRGKTYKISGCDNSLYYNGTDRGGDPVYTSIYLMGLEGNKLSESGVGIFYTPKYSEFDIFVDGNTYSQDQKVIWGGYVWNSSTFGTYNSIDLFTLDPTGFNIIYPFDDSDAYNTSLYNIQYDDIIYDYTNDRIIYRNEENSNIVSTTYENINYWINDMRLYNPIRVFQWGNVYNGSNGIGNQTIVNSYNENINYTGRYQINLNFKNRSYQTNINSSVNEGNYQDGIILENYSYIDSIDFERGPSYQSNIELSNNSYISSILLDRGAFQDRIILNNNSYIINGIFTNGSYQKDFVFNNSSYMDTFVLGNDSYQQNFNFNNSSYQNNSTLDGVQEIIYMDRGSQSNGFSESQTNITVKGYDIDWSTYPSISPQTDLFFIHNLISDDTAPVYIGKINNRLVEVTVGGGVSDLRTKNNIEYITGDTSSIINQLKPVKFEFNNYSGITRHGFIAQDVLEIDSKLVLGDGKKENGMYGLDYYGILALTVKSLQEANNRIDVLEKIIKDSQPK